MMKRLWKSYRNQNISKIKLDIDEVENSMTFHCCKVNMTRTLVANINILEFRGNL